MEDPFYTAPVFILNSSHPELDRLAAELCRRGLLKQYLRRYAVQNRRWEIILQRLPLLSSAFGPSARRHLVDGLDPRLVVEAGVLYDFLRTLFAKLPLGPFSRPISRQLLVRRERSMADRGAQLGVDAPVVVGNYSVALKLFRRAKLHGRRTVLNYPIAHHDYAKALLEEEAEREPAFAESLLSQIPPRKLAEQLDYECALADQILLGSTFARESFLSSGFSPEKLVAIPYGADVSGRFTPGHARRHDRMFRILFVGQITQRKGITYLFHAYDKVKGPGTELALAGRLVGGEPAYRPYRHLFRHVEDMANAFLPDFYRSGDVLVLPTLIEGMGLVVLEAMACGLPVIVSPNGPGDIVRDGIDGFVVPVRDVDAIAEKLELLRADENLRQQMGIAARQRALEFSWDRYAMRAADAVLGLIPRADSFLK